MHGAWFPWLEANQGFLSLVALVSALIVAGVEYVRAGAAQKECDADVARFVQRTLKALQNKIPEIQDADGQAAWTFVQPRVIEDAERAANTFDALASSGALGKNLVMNLFTAATVLRDGAKSAQNSGLDDEIFQFRANLQFSADAFGMEKKRVKQPSAAGVP